MVTFFPSSVTVKVVMAYLQEKRRSAPRLPKKKRRMTMVIFFPSSAESCEGGHGLCHHLLEKKRSALLVLGTRNK